MNETPMIFNGLLGNVQRPFPIDGKTAVDAATMNGVQQENQAVLNELAGQAAQDAAARQFYADQQAHPEWFEGDTYLGGNPADHLQWRKDNPEAARKVAEKALPTIGLLSAGNIDLAKRPIVHNADGSYSTVASMSFQDDDGSETLIPTVAEDGSGLLSDEDAIQQYRNTGHYLGKFSSPEAADNYALALHDQQDAMYGQQAAQQAAQAAQPWDIAQGLLGAYAADTPAQRAFDAQLYDQYVRPQMNAALQPYRDAQYAENEAAIRRANPETVMGEKRQIVNGLAQAKAQYDAAKAAGNEQGMALAHQAAEMLRQQAQSIGLDLGAYGGDADTQTMAQALANNDARAMASVIDNDMTPEQYYQQLYNQARNSGMGRKESEGYAQAHTERYQAERNARMQSAFYTYGLSGNAITPYGMQILTKWAAGEDPQAFLGIVSKTFGLPIDEYKLGNQRTLLGDQNKYSIQQIGVKHQANMQEIGLKGQIQAKITQLDGQIKAALAQQQFGYAQELQRQKFAAQAYLKSFGGGGGGSRGGGSKKGGWTISDAKNVVELYNKWNEDHPDESESANPYADGKEKADAVLNDDNPVNVDPDDYNSVWHYAQNVVEQNYRDGYKYTDDDLAQIISSIGGYGPQVAEEMADNNWLVDYGKKK